MEIQRLSERNIHLLPDLFHSVFGTRHTLDFFKKKYASGYLGFDNLGFIALENNRGIAFCGAVPLQFAYGEKTWLAAQSLECITHPKHRGKGLFTKLSRMIVELARARGFSFVIGFPNQNIAGIFFAKIGYKELHRMYYFSIPTGLNNLEFAAKRIFSTKEKRMLRQQRILHDFDSPSGNSGNPVLEQGFAGTLRDEAYYGYKKFTGNKVCAINGSIAWLKPYHRLNIGEITCEHALQLKDVVELLKEKARKAGIREIVFQSSEGTKAFDQFSSLYPSNVSWPVAIYDFNSGFPFNKLKLSYSDVDVF